MSIFLSHEPYLRPFDCGKHKCEKPCHPPSSKPATCPRSPSKITHCPCGKCSIAPTKIAEKSQYTFPARLDCSDPIPTCTSVCSKPHPACGHPCMSKCHNGPCPPCSVQITRPCRCGTTTRSLACHMVHSSSDVGGEEKEILCEKPCQVLRACGRHQCRRLCCPLASLAVAPGRKGKKRAGMSEEGVGIGEEQGGLHECDLVCGKTLSCGNHKCEERDHKGICPPCLRSSFEEVRKSMIFLDDVRSDSCFIHKSWYARVAERYTSLLSPAERVCNAITLAHFLGQPVNTKIPPMHATRPMCLVRLVHISRTRSAPVGKWSCRT